MRCLNNPLGGLLVEGEEVEGLGDGGDDEKVRGEEEGCASRGQDSVSVDREGSRGLTQPDDPDRRVKEDRIEAGRCSPMVVLANATVLTGVGLDQLPAGRNGKFTIYRNLLQQVKGLTRASL